MAKRRRRSGSLAEIATELEQLDARRRVLIAQLRDLTAQLTGGPELPGGRSGGNELPGGRQPGGRRPGFKMSAEAKATIAAAQRKRWAKAKKGQTGYEAGNG